MQVWHGVSEADIENGLGFDVFSRCPKSKHHPAFIDMSRSVECSSLTQEKVWKKTHVLELEDLPGNMQHPEILRWVRSAAKHTVRIYVSHTSADRPDNAVYGLTGAARYARTGTGSAWPVDTTDATESDLDPTTMFRITTAGHVVYDQQEVENTWVHFFAEDQDDRSGVIVAKGVKMMGFLRDADGCMFVCQVDNEKQGDVIRQQWMKNTCDKEKMLKAVTSSFAFTVSHPHSLSQKFSAGAITTTNIQDFGGDNLKLLTHCCCDLGGIGMKKVLFSYFMFFLNKDRGDFWTEDFLSFLTNHRQDLTHHLVKEGLMETATWQEMMLMKEMHDQLCDRCDEMDEEELRKQTTGRTVTEAEKKRMGLIIRVNIVHSLPCVMWPSSEFRKLKKSIYRAIYRKVRETVGHKIQLTKATSSPRYSVATCAGSSGARIRGVVVSGRGRRIFTAIHHAGGDTYNVGGLGGFVI